MFVNVRVFALTQTYLGFKIIDKAYKRVIDENKNIKLLGDYHGRYYNLLRDKYLTLS